MSAFGPKQTSPGAAHMSAFGGKADIPFVNPDHVFDDWTDWFEPCPLSGVKQTGPGHHGMSAMTQSGHNSSNYAAKLCTMACSNLSLGGDNEATRVHHAHR